MNNPEAAIISYVLDKAIALVRRKLIDLMVKVAELEREIIKLKGQYER